MSRHIVLMGGPRAGTCWVPLTIQRNVVPAPNVGHEVFREDMSATFKQWDQSGVHIAVGWESAALMPVIHKRYPDAQWACLHRHPIRQLESVVRTWGAQPSHHRKTRIGFQLMIMGMYWSALEAALRFAAQNGIEVPHWHMDYYTTKNGFRELAKSLDLAVKPNIDMSAGRNGDEPYRYSIDSIPGGEQLAWELFDSHKLVKQAYEAARRS